MDRNLIMSITLCKLNYVKLKKFAERMGAFTGRTHRFRLHAQHAGLAHGGLFGRKKPYQEVP